MAFALPGNFTTISVRPNQSCFSTLPKETSSSKRSAPGPPVFFPRRFLRTLGQVRAKVREGRVGAKGQQIKFAMEALASAVPSAILDAEGVHFLTKRELSVVTLVAEGRSSLLETSRKSGFAWSEQTVRNYLFWIYNKLVVRTRLEPAVYALNQRGTPQPELSPTTR